MPLIYSGKRSPAVAGMFYEADEQALKAQIEWAFKHPLGPGSLPQSSSTRSKKSIGFVAPHAGYMYSGPIAAHAYYKLAEEGMPETIIIIGPNHTGLGSLVSVYPGGSWLTPLGEVEVDADLSKMIASESEFADLDEKAHLYEHSVEVQLPFLQYIFGSKFTIVPIVVWDQSPRLMSDLASAIKKAVEKLNRDVVIIASSDFTHYEPYEIAYKKDQLAINAILSIDPEALYRVVEENSISMCGPGAVSTLLYYARSSGGKAAELLKYATSGDTSGDKSSVVGYAAIRVY